MSGRVTIRTSERSRARGRTLSRIDDELRARRDRARSHYARVRRRRQGRGVRRLAAALAFALSCALGSAVGDLRADALLDAIDPGSGRLAWIEVLGASHLEPEEIAKASGLARGSALAEIDPEAVRARLREHPWIRDATTRRAPGGSMVVAIEERVPVALLRQRGSAEWRGVEADGTPFGAVDADAYPELLRLETQAPTAPPDGEPLPAVPVAIALADSAEQHGLGHPIALRLPDESDPEGWVVRFDASGPRIVLGDREIDARLARLAELVQLQPAAVRAADRVDLRFRDRAILRAADGRAVWIDPSAAREARLPAAAAHESAGRASTRHEIAASARLEPALREGPAEQGQADASQDERLGGKRRASG